MIKEISLENGKYRFILDESTWHLKCLRHGEEWREFVGDKAIHALFNKAVDLQEELQSTKEPKYTFISSNPPDETI